MRYFSLLLLVFLSACTRAPPSCVDQRLPTTTAAHPWTHLEIEGGNYGDDGHTKVSQRKTVLKKLRYVSKATNYIDKLPEHDPLPYDPTHQYAVLFGTLDTLVATHGPNGVFFVNDVYPEYANKAVACLRHYAHDKGYTHVTIEPLIVDERHISPKTVLAPYGGKAYFDSVHFKNPEVSFYHFGMDGDTMLSDKDSRQAARQKLQYFANLGKEGLFFFPLDEDDWFIPPAEKTEFINKGIFYHPTKAWEPVAYYFPEGKTLDKKMGKVYFIKRTTTVIPEPR